MGINKLNPTLKSFYGSAYKAGPLPMPDSKSQETSRVVEDVMTRMFLLPQTPMTGAEVAQAIMKPILALGEIGVPVQYVLITDKQSYKPPQKAPTSGDRFDKWLEGADMFGRPNRPYPDDSKITAAGITINGDTTEPIDVNRLMNSRPVREVLWRFLRTFIPGMALPDNVTLVLDICEDVHPLWIAFDARQGMQCTTERPDLMHKIGEGDLALFFWMDVLLKGVPVESSGVAQEIVFQTTDTDTLAIFYISGRFHEMQDRHVRVKWSNSANGYVDMTELCIRMDMDGWSPAGFFLFCVLCGCDFFDKASLTHMINEMCIFQACRAESRRAQRAIDVKPSNVAFAVMRARYLKSRLTGKSAPKNLRASELTKYVDRVCASFEDRTCDINIVEASAASVHSSLLLMNMRLVDGRKTFTAPEVHKHFERIHWIAQYWTSEQMTYHGQSQTTSRVIENVTTRTFINSLGPQAQPFNLRGTRCIPN